MSLRTRLESTGYRRINVFYNPEGEMEILKEPLLPMSFVYLGDEDFFDGYHGDEDDDGDLVTLAYAKPLKGTRSAIERHLSIGDNKKPVQIDLNGKENITLPYAVLIERRGMVRPQRRVIAFILRDEGAYFQRRIIESTKQHLLEDKWRLFEDEDSIRKRKEKAEYFDSLLRQKTTK